MLFLKRFSVLLFLVFPWFTVTVQPCMYWISIKKKLLSLGQYAKSWAKALWKVLKLSIPRFAFSEVSSISKHNMRVKLCLLCLYFRYYNILEKLPPSVLLSIDLPILIFSTFGAFNYYSMMGSMNYFGQVVLEILENN